MAISDQIIRRGSNGKRVLTPANTIPKYLWGPTSDRRHKVGKDVDRISGDVDLYEVATSICAPNLQDQVPPTGDYTFTIDSWLEKGMKQYVKAIRWVAVIRQKADKTAELLYRKPVVGSDRKTVAGPFKVDSGEKLFLSISREGGVSAIQYRLSLDAANLPTPAPPFRSVKKAAPKPKAVIEQEAVEEKAWDMVKGDKD
jgi:hypothetical protein